jgi:hypothetical protein
VNIGKKDIDLELVQEACMKEIKKDKKNLL